MSPPSLSRPMSSSATADAQAARALVQAVLITWLCDRYHDLASVASESLKQRIHFLSLPNRSNLKELCTWDPPSAVSSSSSSTACPAWSPAQIDAFIHDSWSPDQLPLHPPNIRLSGTTETTRSPLSASSSSSSSSSFSLSSSSFDSWDTTPVLVKQLDEETIQAQIPIGQAGASILVMILSSELESIDENSQTGKKVPRWKYHNMVAVSESHLMGAQSSGWKLLSEHQALKEEEEAKAEAEKRKLLPASLGNLVNGTLSLPPLSPAGQDTVGKVQDRDEGEGEDEEDDYDSDDDYWGQYGDTEDESTTDENNEGADSSKAKEQNGIHLSEAVAETPNDEDDDDDEEYWRKYAEQQERQEAEERKKKLKSQRGNVSVSVGINGNEDDSMGSRRVLAEIEDPAPTSQIGQVDPNMLSSLLQMLSTQGLQQDLPVLGEDRSQEEFRPAAPVEPLNDRSQSSPSSSTTSSSNSISTLERSLRAAVTQAKLDGLSKEQVFEVLSGIYKSSSFQ